MLTKFLFVTVYESSTHLQNVSMKWKNIDKFVIVAVRHKRMRRPRRPFIQNKADYYRLLLQVTREQEWEPWLLYVISTKEADFRFF